MSFQYFLDARNEGELKTAFGAWKLDGLKRALSDQPVDTSRKSLAVFKRVDVPRIIKLAESLDAHFPAGLPLLREPGIVAISRPAAAAIIARMFLGAPPVGHWPEYEQDGTFKHNTMNKLISSAESHRVAKLQCFLEYLQQVTAVLSGISSTDVDRQNAALPGTLYMRRVKLSASTLGALKSQSSSSISSSLASSSFSASSSHSLPRADIHTLATSNAPLLPITLRPNMRSDGAGSSSSSSSSRRHVTTHATVGLESVLSGALHADFANEWIGGGILGRGNAQEEVMFCASPELLASKLICPVMQPDEALVITGIRRMVQTYGYRRDFLFKGARTPEAVPTAASIFGSSYSSSSSSGSRGSNCSSGPQRVAIQGVEGPIRLTRPGEDAWYGGGGSSYSSSSSSSSFSHYSSVAAAAAASSSSSSAAAGSKRGRSAADDGGPAPKKRATGSSGSATSGEAAAAAAAVVDDDDDNDDDDDDEIEVVDDDDGEVQIVEDDVPAARTRGRRNVSSSSSNANNSSSSSSTSSSSSSSLSAAHSPSSPLPLGVIYPADTAFALRPADLLKSVVAIDATYFEWGTKMDEQLRKHHNNREIIKALVGFSADGPECSRSLFPAVSTGHWGCGAFHGDRQRALLIQWIAASAAGRSLIYHMLEDKWLAAAAGRASADLTGLGATVGQLMTAFQQVAADNVAKRTREASHLLEEVVTRVKQLL